ncbi:GyrI-like domain-containing protein [Paenibacillus sp. NEAU-GSW1]|uniref:AraC family transcriptional regulator n=1 Tax=Paenibacillus sp. NEAU-GSW1 TaxID=2682486 RepID=UPI0012E203E8|nr:helix-turn-helix domain-containing protein [Paenibacillus sp. NEAU-GSW1]MUT68280.1 helix-turn-helix domain-containing protein [Paenibacillus sp. NEAU-GSW1]
MIGNDGDQSLNQQTAIFHVMHYIDGNIHNKLSLNELASIVSYSPYHLHRLFKSVTGVNLNAYIANYRLQKVTRYLQWHPHLSLTAIAEQCGFSSLNDLSRKYKAFCGQTATQVREFYSQNRKICIMDRNISERYFNVNYYNEIQGDGRSLLKENRSLKVTVKMLPQYRSAYIPLLGSHAQSSFQNQLRHAFQRLAAAASRRNTFPFQRLLIGKVHYETDMSESVLNWRYDACVTLPQDWPADDLPMTEIPGGSYAVLRIDNDPIHKKSVLDAFYQEWLPDSGHQLSDLPCLEVFGSCAAFQNGIPAYVDYCIPLLD